jgi:hypothetical protein
MITVTRLAWLWLLAATCGCGNSNATQFYVCNACGSLDGQQASCSTFSAAVAMDAVVACEGFFTGKICTCKPGLAASAGDCGLCSGPGYSDASDWTCAWHTDCGSRAPHAAYDCAGGVLYQCQTGTWVPVVDCGLTTDSVGGTCTCVGGCQYDETACVTATETCAGKSFLTCGPNATATTASGAWYCQ